MKTRIKKEVLWKFKLKEKGMSIRSDKVDFWANKLSETAGYLKRANTPRRLSNSKYTCTK
jgi:hypothetical protein